MAKSKVVVPEEFTWKSIYRPERTRSPYMVRRTVNGKRVEAYGATEAEAQAKARIAVDRALAAGERKAKGPSLKSAMLEWLPLSGKGCIQLEPVSFEDKEARLDNHLFPTLGHIALGDLTAEDVKDWHAALCAKMAGTSIPNRVVRDLRAFVFSRHLDFARETRDAIDHLRTPGYRVGKGSEMTREQEFALLEAMEGDPYQALYMATLTSGVRFSEILGMEVASVDLVTGHWTNTNAVKRHLAEGPPKGHRTDRFSNLPESALHLLREHVDRVKPNRLMFPHNLDAKRDRPIRAGDFRRKFWLPLLDRAGIGCKECGHLYANHNSRSVCKECACERYVCPVKFHCIRHTFATNQMRDNIPIAVISQKLGHKNIGVTNAFYVHVARDMHAAADAAIARRYPARKLTPTPSETSPD